MKTTIKLITILGLIPFLGYTQTYEALTSEVNFESSDGVNLFADLARFEGAGTAILLFHQGGGDVRGEYENTLPVLYEMGYTVLATDLRNGGDLFGKNNRTASELEDGIPAGYCDAEPDVQAAIDYVQSMGYQQLILIGSSYSATLVIRVAVLNNDLIRGVIAFSPAAGGPMAECTPNDAMAAIESTLLVVRPEREAVIESVAEQLALARELKHQTYVAKDGVHGSSVLNPERVGESAKASWDVVKEFLNSL